MAMNALVKAILEKELGPAPSPDNFGGLLGWIEEHHPNLYMELWLLDRAGSGILFLDPSHTISWNVATRAAAGDPVAKAICLALDALSPNHCQTTLDTEKAFKFKVMPGAAVCAPELPTPVDPPKERA